MRCVGPRVYRRRSGQVTRRLAIKSVKSAVSPVPPEGSCRLGVIPDQPFTVWNCQLLRKDVVALGWALEVSAARRSSKRCCQNRDMGSPRQRCRRRSNAYKTPFPISLRRSLLRRASKLAPAKAAASHRTPRRRPHLQCVSDTSSVAESLPHAPDTRLATRTL